MRAIAHAFARAGVPMPALRLVAHNVIPHGRGLGSSGAAIVAGVLAAKGLLEGVVEFTPDELLELATELEGHPDNVAPALFGGLTIAWVDARGSAAQEAHRAPRRLAARARARARDVDGARALPAARVGAARGRGVQRVAVGAAHRGAHPEPRAAARSHRGQAAPELPRAGDARDRPAHPRAARRGASGRRLGRGAVDARARRATRASAPMRCASSRSRRTRRGRRCRSPSTSRARRSSTPSADGRGAPPRHPLSTGRVARRRRARPGVRIVPHPAGDAQFASPGRIVQFPAIYCFRSRACLRHRAPTSLVPAISSPGSATLATRGKEHTQ